VEERDQALVELGRALEAASYQFVTVTPETHRRVLAREARRARDLRDVFGWSLPFEAAFLPKDIRTSGERAGVFVESEEGTWQATVRFSRVAGYLLVHSAFPTLAKDSVFLGPDTYRFCSFLSRCAFTARRVVDVGCGTGAGGIVASRFAERVVLSDINELALRFARVNAALAGLDAETVESDVLSGVSGSVDAVIANPPFMADAEGRLYRDGGGAHGEGLSLRIVRDSLARLIPGGRLILYTGAPIVAGRDTLREPLAELCRQAGARFEYEELDPDIFGEQLSEACYEDVERIAAVALVATVS
jgi:methylase of polypeptide subunit release factors